MRRHAWVPVFTVSALLAASVWSLSPLISGSKEPWDAQNHYYPLALAIAGFLAGAMSSRIRWALFVGAVFGQLLFEVLFLKMGPLALAGLAFMCLYSLIFLSAAIVATYLRQRIVPVRPNK